MLNQENWDQNRQYINLKTGVKMSYVEFGNPDNPTLILLHGLMDNSRVWSLSAPFFHQAGYHILMPDLRGHGYSSAPDGFYTLIDYATDIKSFLDQKDIKRASFIGHSMGSLVTQAFMFMFPEQCEKVVLMATGSIDSSLHRTDSFTWLKTQNPNDHLNQDFIARSYSHLKNVPADFLSYLKKDAENISIRAYTNIAGGFLVLDFSEIYHLFDAKIPTLILAGQEDHLMPASVQAKIRQNLPFAKYKEYADVSHNIECEIPEQFSRDVINWLKK